MNYAKKTFTGLAWVSASRGAARFGTVIKILILARLLTPAQFGLFGIAALVLSLLEIITETGINVFLIQEKAGLEEYLDTAWITSIIRGCVISVLLLVGAYPISRFFDSPGAVNLILLASLVPLIRGFINPAVVSLQKTLRFSREFGIKAVIAAVEVITAVVVGLATMSAIALVWSMVASAVAEVLITWLFITPRPKVFWNKSQFLTIVGRGKWVTLAGLFNYLFQEGDDIAVGKLVSSTGLGLYQTAYKIAILPLSEITDAFGRVTFPIYSTISTDLPRLRRAFFKTALAICGLTLPVSLVIFLIPGTIITLLLGPSWVEAAPALRILAIFGLIRSVSNSSFALFLAVKKQVLVTAVTLVSFFGLGLTVVPLVWAYGLEGAAFSALLGSLAALPIVGLGLMQVLFPTRQDPPSL